MRDRFHVWITVPVRWGDMDAYGHVNNAAYFTYCESARIRYFEAIDLDRFRVPAPMGPIVATATCNFRRQLRYPETLEVGARCSRLGRSSFTLEYGLFRKGTDDPVADGSSVVVWVDYDSERSTPLPAALREHLRDFDDVPP